MASLTSARGPPSHRPLVASGASTAGSKLYSSPQKSSDNVFSSILQKSSPSCLPDPPLRNEMPSGPIDTAGLSHAELVHHFWHFFRQQVATLKESVAKVQQDVARVQAVSPSDIETRFAEVNRQIARIDSARDQSDKEWKRDSVRLSADIAANQSLASRIDTSSEKLSSVQTAVRNLEELVGGNVQRALQEEKQVLADLRARMEAGENNWEGLRRDLGQASEESRRNRAELEQRFAKDLNALQISTETNLLSATNAIHAQLDNEVSRLQQSYEAQGRVLSGLTTQLEKQGCDAFDSVSTLSSNIRVLDSNLRELVADESATLHREIDDRCMGCQRHYEILKTSAQQCLEHAKVEIERASEKHKQEHVKLDEKLLSLDITLKTTTADAEYACRGVDEIKTIPLIRGALTQGVF